jgi:hypothetical protein
MTYSKPEIHHLAAALDAIQSMGKQLPPLDNHTISQTTVAAYEADE